MKKISSLFVIFIILFNFLLPFSIVLDNNFIQKNTTYAGECTVTTAEWNPSGEQDNNSFFRQGQTKADIVVKTTDCVGKRLKITVFESDGVTNTTDDAWNDSNLEKKEFTVPTDNFTINVLLGEEDCATPAGFETGWDCDLYFWLYRKNGDKLYSSNDTPNEKGWLWYDCEGTCFVDGNFLGITPNGDNSNPININPEKKTISTDDKYKLLAPIGDFTEAPDNIGDYFNIILKIAIGLCGVLAVIMIVIGGIQYMGDESIFSKTEAKSKITAAIFGLLIALGAYALLNTINPALLGGKVNIKQVKADIGGDTDEPIGNVSLPSGIVCSGGKENIPNIVNSFDGKMTYKYGAKGTPGPENTIQFDCSGFVNQVLKCAGVSFINGGTASIFSGAEVVTSIQGTKVNNIELGIGDLVGWKAEENGEEYGHVMIYIGNGNVQVADSHGGSSVGKALGVFSINRYKDRIKYIRRQNGSTITNKIENEEASVVVTNGGGLQVNIKKHQAGYKYQFSVIGAPRSHDFENSIAYIRLKDNLGLIPPANGENYNVLLRRKMGSGGYNEILSGELFLKP